MNPSGGRVHEQISLGKTGYPVCLAGTDAFRPVLSVFNHFPYHAFPVFRGEYQQIHPVFKVTGVHDNSAAAINPEFPDCLTVQAGDFDRASRALIFEGNAA